MAKTSKAPAAPVYFRALEVENVRCFGPKQRLDLTDKAGRPARWTLILGDNGTGKTTLLQSIALLTPTWEGDRRAPRDPRFVVVPRVLADLEHEDMLLRQRGTMARFRAQFAASLTVGASAEIVEPMELGGSYDGTEGKFFTGLTSQNPGPFFIAGYGASRHVGRSDLAGSLGGDSTASLFDAREPLLSPEEWLLRMDYVALSEGSAGPARTRLNAVRDLLVRLLPEVDAIELSRPSGPAARAAGSLEDVVRFATPYGEVPLRRLSLGYQTMIAWMVDFAARMVDRYPDSPDPLAEPAVCLVDEIDLHLHPRWQRGIVRFLTERFPNTQFVATAHSPLVALASEDANVVVLRREDDHVVIDSDPHIVRGWRVDQLLLSDVYGLESVRSPGVDALLRERTELLTKSRLSKTDKQRLAELDAAIGRLPSADNRVDQDAMDIIHAAAEHLRKKGAGG